MTSISPAQRILLRGIIIVYLLLFVTAFACSGYLLKGVIELKPIPMIGLLKYLLLCVLFVILLATALKAFSLQLQHIHKFYRSATNFKWLFLIALIISVAAKLGLFDTALHKQVAVTGLQIGILLILGIFCFWSDHLLALVAPVPDPEELKSNGQQEDDPRKNQQWLDNQHQADD